jgi:hypothetical protein
MRSWVSVNRSGRLVASARIIAPCKLATIWAELGQTRHHGCGAIHRPS